MTCYFHLITLDIELEDSYVYSHMFVRRYLGENGLLMNLKS